MDQHGRDVRFVPKADIMQRSKKVSTCPCVGVAGRTIPIRWTFVVLGLTTISKVVGRALNSGSVVGTSKI